MYEYLFSLENKYLELNIQNVFNGNSGYGGLQKEQTKFNIIQKHVSINEKSFNTSTDGNYELPYLQAL